MSMMSRQVVIPSDPTPTSARRLWRPLARPFTRTQPHKGLDRLGERAIGAIRTRREARLDNERAHRIIAEARKLRSFGEGALNARVEDIAEAAGVGPIGDRAGQRHGASAAIVDDAFAAIYEIVRRELGLSLHHEQVLGGLVMAAGCCAELATGEGKTVTAILPAALEAWGGRGVHVVTVNDYLARRDAEATLPAYKRLRLTVGVLQDDTKTDARREAYQCSITYGADKQFIFDHLRDRLSAPLEPRLAGLLLDDLAGDSKKNSAWTERVVQRELNCAIVDEADSVLIDEAVTPAIIGEGGEEGEDSEGSLESHYHRAARIARELEQGKDYRVDHRLRSVRLTEAGQAAVEAAAWLLPSFWAGPRRREELVTQAITAKEIYILGDDYILKEDEVVIVDRSTGRVLPGRKWQLGVHQAVEAKEGLAVSEDRRTTARVSYQQFFQRYRRLSGMSGTAAEVAAELWSSYKLPVVRIPTHKPVVRVREPDRFFVSEAEKFEAVALRVVDLHARGVPVLIGTRSVASSERLGSVLAERGVVCSILNATREAEEAAIIARAGERGAVTVATNMAGRGTDIRLGDGVRALGGLTVIATERHDEARVDRQLFGRAGRQGDPGRAEAFVSLEDLLIVVYAPKFLRFACERAPQSLLEITARATWAVAQWSAGRKASVMRSQVLRADAWTDMALHHRSR